MARQSGTPLLDKMKYLQGLIAALILSTPALATSPSNSEKSIYDQYRDRHIPIAVTQPVKAKTCSPEQQCPVAFLSAGYGVAHSKYTFLAQQLSELGYLVVAIAHELPQDPPLSTKGNLFETRSENWQRGADTLDFLQKTLANDFPGFDFDSLLLVGHSNGGDISAWLANEGKPYVDSIITLDHRRVPLPRDRGIKILTLRGSDFPADKGVLPSSGEVNSHRICVVKIPESRHNDMSDYAPDWLKQEMLALIVQFLNHGECNMEDTTQ